MRGRRIKMADTKHKDGDLCCVNDNVVEALTEEMPPEEELYDLAELFKVFGDSTRIRILYLLFESELCVGNIAEILGISQTACSHQLRVLKANKLVKFRREGKIIYYSLSDDHVRKIIDQGMEHIGE
jgi:ArsR family transcriptional regulator